MFFNGLDGHFLGPLDFVKDLIWVDLQAQGRDFGIFVLEQSASLRFNRGMLLNSGVALLAGSDYDYFVFHDVDTVPTETGAIPYDFPYGEFSQRLEASAKGCTPLANVGV